MVKENLMLEINHHQIHSQVGVLEISGAIDGSTAPELRDAIMNIMPAGQHLILDMKRVHFMSSAGLRVMLLLHRELQKGDTRVILVGMLEPIYDAMEATGFLKYFETAVDIDAAQKLLES